MTWQQIRLITLQKMFAIEGNTINENDEGLRDYLSAMPAAANEGMLRLTSVGRQLIRQKDLGTKAAGSALCLNLKQLLPDFYDMGMVLSTANGLPHQVHEAQLLAGCQLLIPAYVAGPLTLYYKALPAPITAATPGDEILPLDAELAVLLPLYMASQLYKEDDLALATGYRNEFEVALEGLQNQPLQTYSNDFTSETHWW